MKAIFLTCVSLLVSGAAFSMARGEYAAKMYAALDAAPIRKNSNSQVEARVEYDKQSLKSSLDIYYAPNSQLREKLLRALNSAMDSNENIIYSFFVIYPDSASYHYSVLTSKKLISVDVTPFFEDKGYKDFLTLHYRPHTAEAFKLLTSRFEELKKSKGGIFPYGGTATVRFFFSVYENNIPVNTFVLYGDFEGYAPDIKLVFQTCYDFHEILKHSPMQTCFKTMVNKLK